MMQTANPSSEVFPQIWAALTTDHLMSLLSALSPRPHGRHLTFACPSCGKPEAYIYEPKDGRGPRLHCNRRNNCGHNETLWEYVRHLHDDDGKEALAALAATTGVRLEGGVSFKPKEARLAQDRARFALKPAPEIGAPVISDELSVKMADYQARLLGSPGEAYLVKRGLDPAEAAKMGFGYCPSWPSYSPTWPAEGRARLAYPLTDKQGHIVAIEGRALLDSKPKSLCDGIKGAGVFAPRPLWLDGIHLCEGVFDAAFLSGMGLSAVALCGTALPDWLLRACAFRHVWTAFDADEAGDHEAGKKAEALSGRGAVVRRLRPSVDGNDWGDYLLRSPSAQSFALWTAQGVPQCVREMRTDFSRLLIQIEYLQSHERTGAKDRETLLAHVAVKLADFAARCDVPSGYSDADDPFSDQALLILNHHFGLLEKNEPTHENIPVVVEHQAV